MNWHQYFFAMCEVVAQKSKDLNTKLGVVIVGPEHGVRATGFNGFPRGVIDNAYSDQADELVAKRFDRPEKYAWTEHAERNAIYEAARVGVPLQGCSIYIGWMPCAECARAIIQAGIIKVYCKRWDPSDVTTYPLFRFDVALQMFRESGVEVCAPTFEGSDNLMRIE